ncbi:DMT family transporter [Clostridium sp. DJ247]|uniref:DMT family transporter n=1 Tax=Clostridium sp. DJ247 TaxID=2726188 RepID=UPI0016268EAF|nr:DMT family transporter [Clostridium sp. DJ247]MBC2581373.1 DMT family transporter [Clostridium sp. DJ247]
MKKYRVWLLLIICNLFWAGNYVFGKYVVAEITPLWITFSRWIGAIFLLLPVAYFIEKPKWNSLSKALPTLAIMGALGIIGYNLALYSALDYTSAINAALINALNPGVIVLFSVFLLRERISWIQVSGLVVSLIGVLVVLTRGDLVQILQVKYNKGDLIMIAAIIIWTLYSILGKRLKEIPPITATAVSALIAVLMMAPFAIYQGIDMTKITSVGMTGILYMIIFPSVCSFVFWNISIREIGASQAGIFLNFIPVFTAIISWILGNKITSAQVYGGLLVFIGIYLTTGMLERRLARTQLKV